MSGTLRSTSLRYVGLQQDTSIYELQSAQFANKYFIISGLNYPIEEARSAGLRSASITIP